MKREVRTKPVDVWRQLQVRLFVGVAWLELTDAVLGHGVCGMRPSSSHQPLPET